MKEFNLELKTLKTSLIGLLIIVIIGMIIALTVTLLITKDNIGLTKENKQLRLTLEEQTGEVNRLQNVIDSREEEFNSVEVYKTEIDKLQEENSELRREIIILQRRN